MPSALLHPLGPNAAGREVQHLGGQRVGQAIKNLLLVRVVGRIGRVPRTGFCNSTYSRSCCCLRRSATGLRLASAYQTTMAHPAESVDSEAAAYSYGFGMERTNARNLTL